MLDPSALLALLLLGLPLLAFLVLWSGGRRLNFLAGPAGVLVTAAGLLVCFLYAAPDSIHTFSFDWVSIGTFPLTLTLRFDALTWLMLLLVHFVALLVQIYSTAYLSHERSLYRYFAFLQLFVFSMLGIVLSGGLLLMYIFWELVGLSSYLLIGFWYQRPRAVWAAKKAFVMNRIGDAAFLTGILLLLYTTGSTDFEVLTHSAGSLPPGLLTGIGLCLFGGCVGKSAQFPLSAWLPDAMEGPTPVSALIHAATMVAAGIFLLARIAFLFTPTAQLVVLLVGTFTMLRGALSACRAWDIKRVLAFSTVSQLGLMVLAVGVGSWQVALFHLTTHAFFKAGLFLSAGSVIHAMVPLGSSSPGYDPQDMRTMGGLRQVMPLTFGCFVVCAAALAGLPFFSGFLSKDAIFLQAFAWAAAQGTLAYLIPILALAAAGLTAYYMTRQVWLVFMGEKRYLKYPEVHPHEAPARMGVPMALLALLSLFVWFSFNPLDAASGWFMARLAGPDHHAAWVPWLSVAVTLAGISWGYFRFGKVPYDAPVAEVPPEGTWPPKRYFSWLAEFSEQTQQRVFFLVPFQQVAVLLQRIETRLIDALVNAFGRTTVVLAHVINWIDRHVVDGGVWLITYLVGRAGRLVRLFQNGKIQTYYLTTVLGLFLLLLWLWLL
ncbi:hypothetical protein GCM10027275_04470 [Rhabdobacter roseus]|uniref:NADH-quinone oxidoreductase subunit L n=1 Tax=Rhabdobacter roseus TaxID=1655419 RepID=A0A840TQQ8_9BACT|nr:NADH-quinone oxidoreductase subunit L [Rhabdobacter roseus]MBB5282338.1 NADH-quinone oxidoreductase subunit L [Rhabdobacter roseus]